MTPAELETFVAKGNARKFVDAAKGLTEVERKKLSTTAQKLHKETEKAKWEYVDNQQREKPLARLMSLLGREKVTIQCQAKVAVLAVQAFAPLSQVRKTSFLTYVDDESFAIEIMKDRRPDWIDDWVAGSMGGEFPALGWHQYRQLLKGGYCKKPDTEDYYRFFATGMNYASWHMPHTQKLGVRLASEPELLEDIWRLFEVETEAFAYDWYQGNEDHQGWPSAIAELCEKELLDRDRLLDATLLGLTTGFKLNVLGGFAKLHERLEPRGEELSARQNSYCDLLSANQSQVVSFAVKMLKKLEQAKALDDTKFVTLAATVFAVSTKGPPKAIIALLKKVAKRSLDLQPAVCRSLVDAVAHPAEDVQSKAAQLLTLCAKNIESDVVEQLQERLEDVAATVRPTILETIQAAGGTVETKSATDDDLAQRLAECRSRAQALSREWIEQAGVMDAMDAMENSSWAQSLQFDMMQVPVLTSVEPVQPIETVEELIDTVAHAIEQIDTGIEVERILDGISRLCDQKPDDFDRRAAPIIKRIEKLQDSENLRSLGIERNGITEVARLLTTWMRGDPLITKSLWGSHLTDETARFLNVRVEGLRARVKDDIAAPLLAMPTHGGGWIDPMAIIDRWKIMQESSLSPPKFELVVALLRMSPDNRSLALERASGLVDDKARALRWALGGSDGPTKKDEPHADIWIAAARSRGPTESFEELAVVGATHAEPNTIRPAIHDWKARVRAEKMGYREQAKTYYFAEIDFTTKPAAHEETNDARPTVLLCRSGENRYASLGPPWLRDWVGTIWPADLQAYLVKAAKALVGRLDDNGSTWEPNHAFLPSLFQPDRPWTEIATLTAILGAISRDQDARGLASDALIEAISDGRANSDLLGHVLSTLSIPKWLKLNRVATSLSEVARVSPLHAWTILRTLERLVVTWDEIPRDAHHVLTLVQELMAQLGLPASEWVVGQLDGAKGSSKTAKLSKAICSFRPKQPSSSCEEARLMTLESRLDRAERWASAG